MPPRRTRRRAIAKDARWCLAFRFHDLDGHVYVEVNRQTGRKVWVARLQCVRCGTERIDFLVPETCELISRRYFRPADYPTDLDRETARRQILAEMLTDAAAAAS